MRLGSVGISGHYVAKHTTILHTRKKGLIVIKVNAGKIGFAGSGFKTFNEVQVQGGAKISTVGIYKIFRGLKFSLQHRNWASGEVLKPLL